MGTRSVRILLVEDNPADARLIRELLKEAPGGAFESECVDRLSVGVERAASGEIDVVLLDLGLPDSSGLGTFVGLRAEVPDLPVVVLTGLDDEKVGLDAVRQGAQDYLVKGSVDGKLLGRVIRYAIERKSAQEELRVYAERLKAFHEIDEAILSARSLNAVAQAALEKIRLLLPCCRASVVALEPRGDEGTILAVTADVETRLGVGTRLPAGALELPGGADRNNLRIVQDVSALPRLAESDQRLLDEGVRSCMNVPLIAEGALVGFLNIGAAGENAFSPEYHEIALEVADVLAVAIYQAFSNAQMIEHTEALALRLAEKARELGSLTGTLANDLNQATSLIQDELERLSQETRRELSPAEKAGLQAAVDAAASIKIRADSLLLLEQVGNADIKFEQVDMAALAQEVFQELQGGRADGAVTLGMGALPPATADPLLVRLILVNLLSNALKATRSRKEPEIEIGGRTQENDNVYFVKDNGIGFGTADAERAFVVFQKLHSPEEFAGVGAGLAVVKRVVERHGGRAWAQGTTGEGAVFSLTLPKGRNVSGQE